MCVCARITEEVFGGHSLVLKRVCVCVYIWGCVFWKCKCVTVTVWEAVTCSARGVTLASCFCTLSEGKRRRCCVLSLSGTAAPSRQEVSCFDLCSLQCPHTMSQSYTDTTQWLNIQHVNSATDKSQKTLAFQVFNNRYTSFYPKILTSRCAVLNFLCNYEICTIKQLHIWSQQHFCTLHLNLRNSCLIELFGGGKKKEKQFETEMTNCNWEI